MTPVHTVKLANGITVLVVENPVADIVATRCFIAGGTKLETAANAGIGQLLMRLLTRGTTRLDSQAIATQIESLGASMGTEANPDYFGLGFKTIGEDFEQVLALSAEILRSPSLAATELELERRLTLQGMRAQQERPFNLAFAILQQLIYGDHPYGLPSLGTAETITSLSRTQLEDFHQQYFSPQHLVVSIAGKIGSAQAIALVEQYFGDWQAQVQPPSPSLPLPQLRPEKITTVQESQQTLLILGYGAPSVISPDYAVLKLIASYLGNGVSSRLFVELREKQGLAYEVSAFYPTRICGSELVSYMGTSPHQAELALASLQAETERLATECLTSHELKIAKSKLLGQYALSKQTNAQIAQIYGWYETLGLGVEFDWKYAELISQVAIADVQRVAEKYLYSPAISIIGPG
ncbi:MAG: pitrilysin family protein [Pseudanabaenaceae cyanobacterium bins.68]|nr:pitrilysin family protein [Pseudanabaenaceae cyanobacterium bins.68]